jgi:hypothetical protein
MESAMKIVKGIFLVGFLLCIAIAVGAESFQNLSVLRVEGVHMDAIVRYNPTITRILNEPVKDSHHITMRAAITHISSESINEYLIVFDPGPSNDPEFIIYEINDEKEKEIKTIPGDELIIPGNGFIYSVRKADETFLKHRKYSLAKGTLEEVEQPFYYVGLKTKTRHNIIIFGDLNYKNEIANIPANTDIEVLINKDKNYLVKTPFGLVGWILLDEACGHETIKDLCFHGD